MKLKYSAQKNRAFTLIEMIGVLAVIAILAALLIPKVFNAINDARVNNAIVSYETMKTAVTDHYGKYGGLNFSNTTQLTSFPVNNYDSILLAEGLIDKPFSVKIGSGSIVLVTNGGFAGAGYSLDGTNNATKNIQTYVVEAQITGVSASDAYDVSTRLDGSTLTPSNNTAASDSQGRVTYTNGTLYMYITGR